MNIHQYIATGIIESYVLGLASPEERGEFEELLPGSPELRLALDEFEEKWEVFALGQEIPPPTGVKARIQDRLRELPAVRTVSRGTWSAGQKDKADEFIHVKDSSTHIRVHKYWRYAFIAIFILAKILLFASVYYYFANRTAEKELQQLKQQTSTEKVGG